MRETGYFSHRLFLQTLESEAVLYILVYMSCLPGRNFLENIEK